MWTLCGFDKVPHDAKRSRRRRCVPCECECLFVCVYVDNDFICGCIVAPNTRWRHSLTPQTHRNHQHPRVALWCLVYALWLRCQRCRCRRRWRSAKCHNFYHRFMISDNACMPTTCGDISQPAIYKISSFFLSLFLFFFIITYLGANEYAGMETRFCV